MPIKAVDFSTMNIALPTNAAEDFLGAFTQRHQISAKMHNIDWHDAWNELVRYGLNSHGPDVSEIGTTWLGGLHSMDALRPFMPSEIAQMGGAEAFQQASWQACNFGKDQLTLAIPFNLDIRVVLYRRDWLQKAGVDEATAFIDSEHFAGTLRSLKAVGHPSPLGLSTSLSIARLIHDIASWVWSAGGQIRSDDGHRMLLMEPKSRDGMQAYFALNEFISPEMHLLPEQKVFAAFASGKCAVAILSDNNYRALLLDSANLPAEVIENTGMAMVMQAPFVGGCGFAIWRYSHHHEEALKLIQYLTSAQAWKVLYEHGMTYTPARLDVLAQSPLSTTPFFSAIQTSLQNGRSFQSGYRWSGVESRLVTVIQGLWADLSTNPDLNIEREIEQRFAPVCDRLEKTILVS